MARDVHNTLGKGFTGVIVQLEAAMTEIGKLFSEDMERENRGQYRRASTGVLEKSAVNLRDFQSAYSQVTTDKSITKGDLWPFKP